MLEVEPFLKSMESSSFFEDFRDPMDISRCFFSEIGEIVFGEIVIGDCMIFRLVLVLE